MRSRSEPIAEGPRSSGTREQPKSTSGAAPRWGIAIDGVDLPASLTTDPTWVLVEEGFTLPREHEVESRFAVSNGYVGVRGSLPEGSRLSAPATYVAGVFDTVSNGNPTNSVPELVIAPDWTCLRISVEGSPLTLEAGHIVEHRRVLDLRQGIFWREWRHRDENGRITQLHFLRLASLADRHALAQSLTITPVNYSGTLCVEAVIESNAGASRSPSDPAMVVWRTARSNVSIALVTSGILRAGSDDPISPITVEDDGQIVHRWEWEATLGSTYRLDRIATIYTSRNSKQPDEDAAAHMLRLRDEGVDRLVAAHVEAWQQRWQAADVVIEGDPLAQIALRFAIYHLTSAANPENQAVSIGARALTGPGYKGHVFWDTEIYLLPFFTYTWPAAARAMLCYRYRTLPAARERARQMGYRGALYAWESADTGEDVTPSMVLSPTGEVIRILTGELEHHISADVAYAVWQYWEATGDDDFFRDAGAEIILETARFWASRGQLESDGRYHIRQVIGPDEYHEDVDDNAFTNGMAQWNLERGAETARILAERWPERWQDLARRLDLSDEEIRRWEELANAMYFDVDPDTGLIEQFDGFFDLEYIDLNEFAGRQLPMDVILGRERIQRSQVIKQPDVVLLLYLLWDRFLPRTREACFRYYDPRTGHGSSLSPAIHALMAARLGDTTLALRYLQQAAEIDLGNTMGNTAGGVHIAMLGGLWQAVVFGFAGVHWEPDCLVLDPHLPPRWRRLAFPLQWRQRKLRLDVTAEPEAIAISLEGEPMHVRLADGPATTLIPGKRLQIRRTSGRWEEWQEVPE
ncbi:MAG TPA: glycosyl hydrolase family 65 protein [Thermomicrobiales bacterium]